MHLPSILREIRARKLELARLDPRAGMPVLPPLGASPRAVAAVERKLGRPLPPSYRELLALHDGFPSLYLGASLLGARPLARGTYVALARLVIELGEPATPGNSGAALVPFGVDASAETVFAFDLGAPASDGELEVVLWINEIGARVESFPAFLELVLDMLGSELDERRRGDPAFRGRAPYPRPLPEIVPVLCPAEP